MTTTEKIEKKKLSFTGETNIISSPDPQKISLLSQIPPIVLYGKGYNQGTIKKGRFVPEQQTDYIFTTVGEEWGFLGSTFLVIIYALFVGRIFYLAENQKNKFARFYGYCVGSILFFHFFINIAMVIGLFPTVGIPLPFFSYGGSSLWGFTILIGIFLIIHYKNNQGLI